MTNVRPCIRAQTVEHRHQIDDVCSCRAAANPQLSIWWTSPGTHACGAPLSATWRAPAALSSWWTRWTFCRTRQRPQSECCVRTRDAFHHKQHRLKVVGSHTASCSWWTRWTSCRLGRKPLSALFHLGFPSRPEQLFSGHSKCRLLPTRLSVCGGVAGLVLPPQGERLRSQIPWFPRLLEPSPCWASCPLRLRRVHTFDVGVDLFLRTTCCRLCVKPTAGTGYSAGQSMLAVKVSSWWGCSALRCQGAVPMSVSSHASPLQGRVKAPKPYCPRPQAPVQGAGHGGLKARV